jgi:hypothetical protein
MVKQVNTADLKSAAVTGFSVQVRVSPPCLDYIALDYIALVYIALASHSTNISAPLA